MIGFRFSSAFILTAIAIYLTLAESGLAAFYSGGRTASSEVTAPTGLTAAHRTLPFGTSVLVTNLRNGKTVVVRIVDRGPVWPWSSDRRESRCGTRTRYD